MKFNFKRLKAVPKISLFLRILLLGTAFFYSYAFKERIDDLWKQLGMGQTEVNSSISRSFLGGFMTTYGARNIKNLATGDKVSVAKNLLDYTKQYVTTRFKPEYEKERASFKPVEPQLKPVRTKEEIQKDEIDKLEKNIKKTEENMKTMNDDMKKIFAAGIEQNKKMLAEYKSPGYELFDMMAKGEKDEQERQIANYKQAVKDWEVTISRRL